MKKLFCQGRYLLPIFLAVVLAFLAGRLSAQETESPFYLQDRGSGLPTSMFATYIDQGQLITYLFFEYYLDHDMEYKPEELGYGFDQDFRGQYWAAEGLIFIAYGITDWLAFELEAAVITASLRKSDDDPSSMPDKLEESGLGDVEGQLRLRWLKEGEYWPELFSYFETVFPLQPDNVLIGTQDWEFKLGSGISKGFLFGTFTLRGAIEYDTGENKLDLGEYALEYVKRLSPYWRIYAGVEGTQDEVELIAEVQWHIIPDKVILKLNSSFGLTWKATDWAPEAGIMVYW